MCGLALPVTLPQPFIAPEKCDLLVCTWQVDQNHGQEGREEDQNEPMGRKD